MKLATVALLRPEFKLLAVNPVTGLLKVTVHGMDPEFVNPLDWLAVIVAVGATWGAKAMPRNVVPAGAVYSVTLLAVVTLMAEFQPAVSVIRMRLFAAVVPKPEVTYRNAPPPGFLAAAIPHPPNVVAYDPLATHEPLTNENFKIVPLVALVGVVM